MNKYKVSIIIPMYNVEAYLEECLESVVNQTLKSIEVILIDDGSIDDTANIAQKYKEKYNFIKTIHQQNKGQGAARNVGIEQALGEYIYFLDSDDYIEIDTMEKLYGTANEERLDLILFDGISFSNDYQIDETQKLRYKKKNKYPLIKNGTNVFIELIRNKDYSCSPCLLFINKTILINNNIRFLEGIIQEDELFTYILLKTTLKVKCINKTYFHRRFRMNSTTTTLNFEKKFNGYYKVSIEMGKIIYEEKFRVFNEDYKYLEQMLSNTIYYYSQLNKKEKENNITKFKDLKKILKCKNFKHRLDFKLFSASPRLYKFARNIYSK